MGSAPLRRLASAWLSAGPTLLRPSPATGKGGCNGSEANGKRIMVCSSMLPKNQSVWATSGAGRLCHAIMRQRRAVMMWQPRNKFCAVRPKGVAAVAHACLACQRVRRWSPP